MMLLYFIHSIRLSTYDDPYAICKEIYATQNEPKHVKQQNQLTPSILEAYLNESYSSSALDHRNALMQEQCMPHDLRRTLAHGHETHEQKHAHRREVGIASSVPSPKNSHFSVQRKRKAPASDDKNSKKTSKKLRREKQNKHQKKIAFDLCRFFNTSEENRNAALESEGKDFITTKEEESAFMISCYTAEKLSEVQKYKLYIKQNNARVKKFFNNLAKTVRQSNDEKSVKFVKEMEICYRAYFYDSFCDFMKANGKILGTLNGFPYKHRMKTTTSDEDFFHIRFVLASNYKPSAFEPAANHSSVSYSIDCSTDEFVNSYIDYIKFECFDKHKVSGELVPKMAIYPIIVFVPEFFHYLQHKIANIRSIKPTPLLLFKLCREVKIIDQMLQMDLKSLKDTHNENDLILIVLFRECVLDYLVEYYTFSKAYRLYSLCAAYIQIKKMVVVKHFQAFYLCMLFTHDYDGVDPHLNNVYGRITNAANLKKKQLKMKLYLEDRFYKRKSTMQLHFFLTLKHTINV